jgi:hypothetical protein
MVVASIRRSVCPPIQMGTTPNHEDRCGMMKSLWTSIQGDPVFMRRVNGWLTIFWLVMIPLSIVTHWIGSVTYVAALSLWALVSGHWSAWQAARVEVNQQAEAQARDDEDLPGEIVERIVSDTQIDGDTQPDRERIG